MIEKPKRPKRIPNQDNKQPQTIQELIRRYDLDNTKIYDYLDNLVLEINNQHQQHFELIFPVGSLYITQNNTNPTEILGFGTWERSKGKVIVGLDENDTDFNAIGKIGGEKQHNLKLSEIPSHNHNIVDGEGNIIAATTMKDGGSNEVSQTSGGRNYVYMSTGYVGGSQPHNNLQPYEVVGYMWIRRS